MKRSVVLLLAPGLVFCASFFLRFVALIQTPFANGWDGYFYVNQVRAFFEEGRMHVSDVSFVYGLLIIVKYIVADDIYAYKIAVSLIAASFSLVLFLLARKWTAHSCLPWFIAAFTLFSPHLTYTVAQYPKNVLGAVLFLVLLYAMPAQRKWRDVLLIVLNFFGHRMTAVMALLYGLLFYGLHRVTPKLLLRGMAIAVALITAVSFLPGLLNMNDIERLSGLFSDRPQFAPVSFLMTFHGIVPVLWQAEVIVVSAGFSYAAILLIKRRSIRDVRFISVLVILTLLIFPFFDWSLDAPAFRFLIVFVLLAPVLLIFIGDLWVTKYFLKANTSIKLMAVLLTFTSLWSFKSYMPSEHDPPYTIYRNISRAITEGKGSRQYHLIIAHKSLAEYIVYATRIEAMSWVPEYDVPVAGLWRVAAGVSDVQWRFYLDPADRKYVERVTPSYCIVREDVWEKFLAGVSRDRNSELSDQLNDWRNPNRERPRYLRRGGTVIAE